MLGIDANCVMDVALDVRSHARRQPNHGGKELAPRSREVVARQEWRRAIKPKITPEMRAALMHEAVQTRSGRRGSGHDAGEKD